MKPLLLFGSVIVVAAISLVATAAVRRQWTQRQLQHATSTLPPLIAHTIFFEEILTSTQGKPVLSTRRTLAVRPDGSTATLDRQYNNAGEFIYSHRHIESADGLKADINDATRSMTVVRIARMKEGSRLARPSSAAGCRTTPLGASTTGTAAGEDDVAGYRAYRFVEDSANARITKWLAPSLGCAELRRLAEFKGPDGAATSRSDLIAKSIQVGADSPDLFTVPLLPRERELQ